jgi:hypothetical protein
MKKFLLATTLAITLISPASAGWFSDSTCVDTAERAGQIILLGNSGVTPSTAGWTAFTREYNLGGLAIRPFSVDTVSTDQVPTNGSNQTICSAIQILNPLAIIAGALKSEESKAEDTPESIQAAQNQWTVTLLSSGNPVALRVLMAMKNGQKPTPELLRQFAGLESKTRFQYSVKPLDKGGFYITILEKNQTWTNR